MSDIDESAIDEDEIGIKRVKLPWTLELFEPIQWGEEKEPVKSVTVKKRLKAKHMKGLSPGSLTFNQMFKLISQVTGESTAFIDELDAGDVMELQQVINGFLSHGPKDGKR